MGMAEQMKKRAIKATNARRSNVVVKTIDRADIETLKLTLEPIIEDNKRMYKEMTEYLAKNSHIYGTKILELKKQ